MSAPLPDEALDAIERAAKEATPGPWVVWSNSPTFVRDATPNGWGILSHFHRPPAEAERNAAFIAAANPASVLALARRVRDAERQRDEARAALRECVEHLALAELERCRLHNETPRPEYIDKLDGLISRANAALPPATSAEGG